MTAPPSELTTQERIERLPDVRGWSAYDVQALAQKLAFDGQSLTEAVRLTFERRGRPVGDQLPAPLTAEFAADEVMLVRWRGFLRRNRLEALDLAAALARMRAFLVELWAAIRRGEGVAKRWPPGGPLGT